MSGVARSAEISPTTTADELDTPSLAGSGKLSLREALRDAAAGDVIRLHGASYPLTRGELVISRNCTLADGAATPGRAVVSGGNASRVFYIAGGAVVRMETIEVRDGNGVGTTLSGYGGGVLVEGTLVVANCVLRNNFASESGGAIQAQSPLTLTDSTVTGNQAKSGGGISTLGALSMTRCTVDSNTATLRGGGLYSQTTTTQVDSCTLDSNHAEQGGAVYLVHPGIFTNCTLIRNFASVDGGALYPVQGMKLESCTVADNNAARGGGIHQPPFNFGSLMLKNSIIHRNNGSPPDLSLGANDNVLFEGANCLSSNEGIESVLPAGKPNAGGQYVDSAFQLSAAGYYAGSNMLTMPPAVKTGSSVRDKGGATTLTKDQRGLQRVVNGVTDIGAAELVNLRTTGVLVPNTTVDLFPGAGLAPTDGGAADELGKPYYTLWYRYTVAPSSDYTNETYSAGLEMFRTGRATNLLIGNGAGAFAYSAEFTTGGPVDLNSTTPEAGAPYEFVRQGQARTIVFRVDYQKGADRVTAWLNPDLTKPSGLRTSFEADASFQALRAKHSGGGGGWVFNDVVVSESSPFAGTYLLGENETGPETSGPGADNFWYEIRVSQRGVLELTSTSGGGNTSHSGKLWDADGRALRFNNTGYSSPDFSINYDVEPGSYYLQVGTNTAAGHVVKSALLPPVVRPPLEIRLIQSTATFNVLGLTWSTVPNSTYALYSSSDLIDWTKQFEYVSTQNSATIIAPPGKSFYRMKKL